MDLTISAIEIWQLAAIKLLFYLFIGLGMLFWFKFRKPIVFISLIAGFLTLTYLVMIYQSKLTWWGLQGDEIFITTFLEKVASGNFFSDFFYGSLPIFYPPLYFWVVGGLAGFLKFNGIQAAQLGVALVLLVTPFLVYFWQKIYWSKENISGWQLILSAALVFIVADWTAVILKPYEFVTAILVVFWIVFLLLDLDTKTLDAKKIIFYGISGGILFLTYYFWFLVIILTIALFKLFTLTKNLYYFGRLALIGLLIILVSLPYTLPLLISYLSFGVENWQSAFFIPEDLNFYLPFFQFSIFGLISLIGLLSIIFYWRKPYVKSLGLLLVSAYLWQLISLFTIFFWQAPFLPAKPFLFLGGAVLSISAAYGIGEFIRQKIKDQKWQNAVFCLGWLLLASQLLGGSFIDKTSVYNQLVTIKKPPREEFVNLINELKTVKDINQLTILSSGVSEISAYLPLDYYISYNIHFSHPAANFSQRYFFISNLASATSAEDFYQKIKQAPFTEIDALLFLKGDNFYPINFWVDNYPLGGRIDEIRIPAGLINEQYFAKIFEDKYFVFFKIK